MIKHKPKRILALALAGLLSVSALSTAAFADGGDEPSYAYTDPYVINYAKVDLGDYEAQAPYLYASPHMGSMQIRNLETGAMESWYTSQQVYNLINTAKLSQGGTGAYASLEAYCVDACTNAQSGYAYQRVNLEDATHFDDTAAARIRSIYLHSFPYIKDVDSIGAAVNAWLEETGDESRRIVDLTGAEAISATQYAIWQVANGQDVVGTAPYSWTAAQTAEELADDVVYIRDAYVDCTEKKSTHTADNIALLNRYLLALEGQTQAQKAVSAAAFSETRMTVTEGTDGFHVVVDVQVDAQISREDELVLTATLGNIRKNIRLEAGTDTYRFVFTDVETAENVYLEINGSQKVEDVFLFESKGGREGSQSMVAYDNSKLPVHAQTVLRPERTLNFLKTTYEPQADGTTARVPLEGIVFDIYFVAEMDAYTAGSVKLPETPDISNHEKVGSVVTGADGKATFSLTELGLPDGIYLVAEQENPAIVEPAAPFYVAVPMMNQEGNGWVYSVDIEPKNQVVPGPEIRKDVTEIENDQDSFDVDEVHTWILRTDIPVDMKDGKRYVISDTLDYRLTYRGNLQVKVAEKTQAAYEETLLLEADTHYILQLMQEKTEEFGTVYRFTVSLTPAGMALVAENVGDAWDSYELRIYFDAVIDSDAAMGEAIPNQAKLEYINSVGYVFEAVSDQPRVYTAGIRLYKYDASNRQKALSGAAFRLARPATAEEIAAGISSKLVVSGKTLEVVYPEFYTDEALTQKTNVVVTDENGMALLYGLAYGNYFLVETQAPAGYHLLSAPVEVMLDGVSHQEAAIIEVANSSEFLLPETGGSGALVLAILGISMLCSGAIVLLTGKKKQEIG